MTLASSPNDQTSATPSFVGQTVVFTGRLASVGHRAARELVERLGGLAADEITSRTTMLVVGAEGSARPLSATGDAEKSNKLKRAEALNTRSPRAIKARELGVSSVLTEEEFCRMGSLRSDESLRQRYHSLRQIRQHEVSRVYPVS